MTINKNDFIEIEFTGIANGQVFDTTNKEKAKEIGIKGEVKPMIISVGNEMIIKGLDKQLPGKEIGKEYTLHLQPEKAFGKRDPKKIQIIPMKIFREKNVQPIPGMTLQMDQNIVKVLSVSGGRVIVDFNNPLAGKEVDYTFKVNKKITDDNEKINSLQDYFFRKRFPFEIKNKKVIFKEPKLKPMLQMFQQKFKEITGYDFEVNENKEEKKEEKDKQENNKETQEKKEGNKKE